MDKIELYKNNFNKDVFNEFLSIFNIKKKLWSKIFLITIYLTHSDFIKCPFEIYGKNGIAIKQK